jgi:integrase
MSEPHSTAPAPAGKPAKPYPDFPLFPHATGRWAKKIRGKLHYFGPWADPDSALKKYLAEKDDLHAGRKPRESTEGVTVKYLVNRFLNAKRSQLEAGELANRTWDDYKAACDLLVSHCGRCRLVADLGPDDFAELRRKLASNGWGPATLGNAVRRMRVVFKFAFDDGLIDRPVRYGQQFRAPSKKTMRLDRAAKGPKLFAAEEVRRMLAAAGPQLKAMILLGINCGFGNADCGNLPRSVVDLDAGVIDYPRPKTGIPRRAVLWPETVAALKEAQARRPEPAKEEDAGLVFLTRLGARWAKDAAEQTLANEMAKVLHRLGIKRKGTGFYALRHTFRTVADESKDQPAVDYIMGHEVPHMSSVYRETISDERLRAVTDHVHVWLFGVPPGGDSAREDKPQDTPAL